MTVKPPAPPPLPDELDRLLRRLRMPYVRRAAPEVIATATSQRWEHAEVLECCSPRRPPAATRRPSRCAAALGLPAGKTFDAWEASRLGDPRPDTERATDARMGQPRRSPRRLRPERKRARSHFIEALGHLAIDKGRTVSWHTLDSLAALFRRHRADDSINKAISKLIRSDLILIDDVGLLAGLRRRRRRAVPRRRRRLRETLDRDQLQHPPLGFDELMPKEPWPPRPSTGSCITPTYHHRRPRQLPARASDRRQGGEAPDLNTNPSPPGGEIRWPPAGRNDGHQRGI